MRCICILSEPIAALVTKLSCNPSDALNNEYVSIFSRDLVGGLQLYPYSAEKMYLRREHACSRNKMLQYRNCVPRFGSLNFETKHTQRGQVVFEMGRNKDRSSSCKYGFESNTVGSAPLETLPIQPELGAEEPAILTMFEKELVRMGTPKILDYL